MYANTLPAITKGQIVTLVADSYAWRKITEEELRAWRDSSASKGMDCAGETKLPPKETILRADGRTFRVQRARVSAPRGYGRVSHCATIVDDSGVSYYARKGDLLVVEA